MALDFYDTPDTSTSNSGGVWTMDLIFHGVWTGTDLPPTDAYSAILIWAANAGVDFPEAGKQLKLPIGVSVPAAPAAWIIESFSAVQVPGSKEQRVWRYTVRCTSSDTAIADQPVVQVTTNTAVANVSAYRVYPTIPAGGDTTVLATNDLAWHGTGVEAGGTQIDFDGNPINYALPVTTTNITVLRGGRYWDGVNAEWPQQPPFDQGVVGLRNSAALGWMGGVGEVLLVGINWTPASLGLFRVTYTFRTHPWKHAIQVPRVTIGGVDKTQSAQNDEREVSTTVWWSQPHLECDDFKTPATLGITAKEWEALKIS
jgi:hypothetical protein